MWDLIVSVPDHCLSFLLYSRTFSSQKREALVTIIRFVRSPSVLSA